MLQRVNTNGIHTIEVADGQLLRYSQTGSGEPLVLLHTIRTQLEYFREIIPILAQQYTVYAVDLPGHGYSSIDTRAIYDEPYFRAAVTSFIERLDIQDATIAGESIGGALALTVAGALPERVKAVISINPYDYDRHYGDGVRRGNLFANVILGTYQFRLLGAVNASLENRLFLGWVLKGGLYKKRNFPRDLLAEFDRVGRQRGYRTVERKTFAGWRSWSEARALYSAVKSPVTLIYGDHDWSAPGERQRNSVELRGVRNVTLDQTGHFASLERPSEIADIILEARN